jgi:membrane protein implicated in regulation of membrane protease activity
MLLCLLLAVQPEALVVSPLRVSASSALRAPHASRRPHLRLAAPVVMSDFGAASDFITALLADETAEAATVALGQAAELGSSSASGDAVVAGVYALLLLAALQLLRTLVPALLNLALGLAALVVLGGSASWYESLPPTVQPLVLPVLVGLGVLVAGAVAVSRVQSAVEQTSSSVRSELQAKQEELEARR